MASLREWSLACHCERSEAISVSSLGINSAISSWDCRVTPLLAMYSFTSDVVYNCFQLLFSILSFGPFLLTVYFSLLTTLLQGGIFPGVRLNEYVEDMK